VELRGEAENREDNVSGNVRALDERKGLSNRVSSLSEGDVLLELKAERVLLEGTSAADKAATMAEMVLLGLVLERREWS